MVNFGAIAKAIKAAQTTRTVKNISTASKNVQPQTVKQSAVQTGPSVKPMPLPNQIIKGESKIVSSTKAEPPADVIKSVVSTQPPPSVVSTASSGPSIAKIFSDTVYSPIIQETGLGINFKINRPIEKTASSTQKLFGDFGIPIRPDNAILIRPKDPEQTVQLVNSFRRLQNTNELRQYVQGTAIPAIRINDVKNLNINGQKLKNIANVSSANNKVLQKGDIIFRRVGADPVDKYTYGAIGDTFYIPKDIPNPTPFSVGVEPRPELLNKIINTGVNFDDPVGELLKAQDELAQIKLRTEQIRASPQFKELLGTGSELGVQDTAARGGNLVGGNIFGNVNLENAFLIRPNTQLTDPKFLNYALQNTINKGSFDKVARGSVVKAINKSDVEDTVIEANGSLFGLPISPTIGEVATVRTAKGITQFKSGDILVSNRGTFDRIYQFDDDFSLIGKGSELGVQDTAARGGKPFETLEQSIINQNVNAPRESAGSFIYGKPLSDRLDNIGIFLENNPSAFTKKQRKEIFDIVNAKRTVGESNVLAGATLSKRLDRIGEIVNNPFRKQPKDLPLSQASELGVQDTAARGGNPLNFINTKNELGVGTGSIMQDEIPAIRFQNIANFVDNDLDDLGRTRFYSNVLTNDRTISDVGRFSDDPLVKATAEDFSTRKFMDNFDLDDVNLSDFVNRSENYINSILPNKKINVNAKTSPDVLKKRDLATGELRFERTNPTNTQKREMSKKLNNPIFSFDFPSKSDNIFAFGFDEVSDASLRNKKNPFGNFFDL